MERACSLWDFQLGEHGACFLPQPEENGHRYFCRYPVACGGVFIKTSYFRKLDFTEQYKEFTEVTRARLLR